MVRVKNVTIILITTFIKSLLDTRTSKRENQPSETDDVCVRRLTAAPEDEGGSLELVFKHLNKHSEVHLIALRLSTLDV